ncbi:MAG: zinc-ribbon domain-containing protein [Candidatus Omnitrophota bacterium]
MIKIEFSVLIGAYLTLTVCSLLVLWMIFERKTYSAFSSYRDFFWQCSICTHVYIDSIHSSISECPKCKSFNKKEE